MKVATGMLIGTFVALLGAPTPTLAGFHDKVGDAVKGGTKCAQEGDTNVTKKVAKRTVKHATERFNIDKMVNDEDEKRAEKEMYDFLKWKLGSPSAVCAQWATAGYKHFEKAYSDEAAAALLGSTLPGEGKAKFSLPPETSKKLKEAAKTQAGTLAAQIERDYGVPPELTKIVVDKASEAAAKQIDRISFDMPKKWDIDNRLVEQLIADRRAAGSTAGAAVVDPRPQARPRATR